VNKTNSTSLNQPTVAQHTIDRYLLTEVESLIQTGSLTQAGGPNHLYKEEWASIIRYVVNVI